MNQARNDMKALSPGEAVGELVARRMLLAILALAFLGLAAMTVFLFLKKPHIAYSAPSRGADLTYLKIWLAITAVGILGTLRRKWLVLSFIVLLLLMAEGGAQLYYFAANGSPYQPAPAESNQKFEPHPLLVGVPKEGSFEGIVHDSLHRRRTDNQGKIADPTYVFAFGGSTTYDLANDDLATWVSDLSRLLGSGFAVENLGVPGYTSLENMIQSLFVFRDAPPVCAIYFEGFNDLRNAHIRGLRSDYSNFHLPSQVGNLSLVAPGFLRNNFLLVRTLLSLFSGNGQAVPGEASDQIDQRLSAIFVENMKLIADIDRHFGVKAIFVPEMANYERLTTDRIRGWLPLVRDKDIKFLLTAMAGDLERAAKESGAVYLGAPLDQDWVDADFTDDVHFSAAGARKFAQSLAPDIARLCR
jgi:hypothetical protein